MRFIFVIFLSVLLSSVVFSQQEDPWVHAQRQFRINIDSAQEEDRVKAAGALSEVISPELEPKILPLIINLLTQELNRGAKDENSVRWAVLEAGINVLKQLTDPKTIDGLLKEIDKASAWRLKFYLIKSLGGINKPEVVSKLIKLLDDKNDKIRIAAIDALRELQAKEATEKMLKLLNEDVTWEIKISIAGYFNAVYNQETVEPLIKSLAGKNLEGRERTEVISVLRALTGVDCGVSETAWQEWWQKKQQGRETNPVGLSETEGVTAVCYGLKTASRKIVFILDVSQSMGWSGYEKKSRSDEEWEPKPQFIGPDGKPADAKLIEALKAKNEEIVKQPVKTRFDVVQKELSRVIYHLDDRVVFTVVFYSNNAKFWKDTLVPATAENKKSAIETIEKLKPDGQAAFYDALELAYKLSGGTGKNKTVQAKGDPLNELGGADTFFLISGGVPNHGKVATRADILSEIAKINQTRKVKINTIALSGPNDVSIPAGVPNEERAPDVKLLREIAELTAGDYVK